MKRRWANALSEKSFKFGCFAALWYRYLWSARVSLDRRRMMLSVARV